MQQDSSFHLQAPDVFVEPLPEAPELSPVPGSDPTPTIRERRSHSEIRTIQYANLPTPIYCWFFDGNDFLLLDFNDAANDLTYGYIADMLGRSARVIFRQHPQIIADLERCVREHAPIVHRGALFHPGLHAARWGVARYCFAPPDMVIVQVDVEYTGEFHD